MIQIPFLYVPIAGVCCYTILLLALAAAKKNRLIRSFMNLLGCYLLWTAGSMLMRLQFYPGFELWYEVSILSLFCIPLLLYNFIFNFVDAKGLFLKRLWTGLTAATLVLTHFEVFLKRPVFIDLGNGTGVFRYYTGWEIAIPCVLFFFIILSSAVMLFKSRELTSAWTRPIVVGICFLFLGNVLSIVPGNIFPWDTLSGIINAGYMFYALYRKRLFRLTLLVSRGTMLAASAVLVSVLFAYWAGPLERMILDYFPQVRGYQTLIIAILFAGIILASYKLLYRVMDNLFVRDTQVRAQHLKEFSLRASKSLNLDEILRELVEVVKDTVSVEKVYVCLEDSGGETYRTAYSASPLDVKSFSLQAANPCIQWFQEHDGCLMLRDFQRSVLYKSMWESEKQMLANMHIECIVPLKSDSDLVGILLLSTKPKKGGYSFDDIAFLESVQSVASIAIKNANLYKKAYDESRIDPLTGLLNRKSFYEKLGEEFERCKNHSIALVILNLDDFKLFNQLYGNREGDAALQHVARIISTTLGSNGSAARYGGKEFALILPFFDTMKALNLAADIKGQIANMNRGVEGESLKVITLSGGVCVYPYAASNLAQLISNADMAVYNAKRSGKNKIIAYSLESPLSQAPMESPLIEGGRYEEYAPTIFALTAAIDAKDHYTFNHSQNVAEYSTALARAIGLNADHVKIIYEAALLHDIGKIGIPEHILTKPGRLTPEEYSIMQKHVENSVAMIRHLPSLDYVIPAAIGHHERWDGKGYPRRIAGEDIPLSARCLAIADAFDAMTTARSYKPAMPVEFAIAEIERGAGTQFDPKLAPVFVELVRSGKVLPKEAAPAK